MSNIFNFFADIFGYVLNVIYNIVNNYGVAIIIFTILLKLIMLPMTIKQQKTMKKTNKIQALSKEIQEKYSNDPQKMNQEIMELYKNEKMSPFSGCLSSILQIIIILSIFFLVSKPLTFMKKVDDNIINEYTEKITHEASETGNQIRYTEISIIKKYASQDERLHINMDFLGLDLSDIPTENLSNWKVYIIPILYIITSFASMKMNTKMSQEAVDKKNKKNKEKDKEDDNKTQEDMMLEMNKNMMYIMPFMTVSIALIAPLGLALYWFMSNLLIIGERVLINKFIKDEEE
ncbi:MAG: YidC/Oxa1 family membrane protein insertase [Candidatus Scatovivens sp.]